MPAANARELVGEYVERVWNRGDAAAMDDLTTPGFVYRLGGQPPRDRNAFRLFLASTRSAFPDWRVEVEAVVADEELVAIRWSGVVTHQGPFHGLPPTGREVRIGGLNMYRVSEGRIAEEWEQMDSLGMLRQLGALPGA